MRVCTRYHEAPAYGERVLLQHEPARHFHRKGDAGDLHHAGHVDRVRVRVRVPAQDAFGRLALIDDDGNKGFSASGKSTDIARGKRFVNGSKISFCERTQTVRSRYHLPSHNSLHARDQTPTGVSGRHTVAVFFLATGFD